MKIGKLILISILFFQFLPAETLEINQQTIADYSPKIGLALGGGSAKGFYHLGIIEALEENNIPISAISGSSMGAVIGGVYSLGYDTEEIKNVINRLDFYNVFTVSSMKKHYPFTYEKGWFNFLAREPIGLADGYSIEDVLKEYTFNYDLLKDFDFDNYPIRLRIVATEFPSGKKVVHRKGPLYKAMMTSVSIPFILKPFYWQGHYYLDGVLAEVVPLSALANMDLDILIGIDVVGSTVSEESIYQLHSFALQYFDINVRNIGSKSIELADIMITIPHDDNLTRIDFVKHKQFVDKGKKIAEKYIPEIRKRISAYDKRSLIMLAKINSKSLKHPDYQNGEKVSLSKLIREIYSLNQNKPFKIDINDTNGRKQLNIYAVENRIDSISIKSSERDGNNKYNKVIQKFIGHNYSEYTVEQLNKAILSVDSDENDALLKPVYNYSQGELKIRVDKVRIDGIEILGNSFIPKDFILDHLKIKLHQEYDNSRINSSLANLYRTGLFQDIYLSYQPLADDQGIVLQVEVEEKPRVSGWIGAEYFSLQNNTKLISGVDYFTTIFNQDVQADIEYVSGKDHQSGFDCQLLFYDIFPDLKIGYQKQFRDLPVYQPGENSYTNYGYEKDQQLFAVNFQTYDYLDIDLGVQNNSVLLTRPQRAAEPNYQNYYLRFSYDDHDKNWFPDKGLKYDLILTQGAVFQDKTIDTTSNDIWYAHRFEKVGTFWLQNQSWHTNANDLMYFWNSPYGFLQPNGMQYNQIYSDTYNYSRISYIKKIMLGSRLEFNIDLLNYQAVDREQYQHTGTGVMFHYPNNLGIFTVGYGSNENWSSWQINLAKRF